MPDIFTLNKPVQEVPEEQTLPQDQPQSMRQSQAQFQTQPQQVQQNTQQPMQEQAVPEQGTTEQESAPTSAPMKRLSTSLPVSYKGTAPGLFSSYCVYPTGITFINQEAEEKLLLFLRRHFITNVPWIFFTFLFLLAPLVVSAILTATNFSPFIISAQMTFVVIAFYYLVVANYALSKFIVWFYHVGIVTPKRLLDLDVDNILTYHLAETEMRDIVDVSYSQKGFFQSFFHFGNVPIQTEAIKANFEFEETPNPAQVADIITDLRPHPKGEH